ncbi:MAG: lipase family protein, partial [Nitriliruptoraceae bacterium]
MRRRSIVLVIGGVALVATLLVLASGSADSPPPVDDRSPPPVADAPVPRRTPVIPAPADPEPVGEVDEPGTLLSMEPYALPAATLVGQGVATFLLQYVTQGPGGVDAKSTGLLFVPEDTAGEPVPLLAVGHGSTGIAPECAPSLSPRPLATMPGVAAALAEGWAVVATDYVGLGTPGPHPYLVGDASGSAILDSITAAEAAIDVDAERIAIWGYSQGGHAALHAADAAERLGRPPVAGVVTFAPITDLGGIVEESHGTTLGTVFLVATAVSWSEVYDDLELSDVVPDQDLEIARALARRCLDPASIPMVLLESLVLRGGLVHPARVPDGAWDPYIVRNTPSGRSGAPILVFHGARDEVVSPAITEVHVNDRCARGDDVELRIVPFAGHLTLVSQVVGAAVAWTRLRFDGEPVEDACPGRWGG